ncbi:alkylmercury lyase [Arthrobacter sp. Hiyo4]|nr:alkylmercury lyase [Arthrobacter sp. Hiyo4]
MKIELLYIDECPNLAKTRERLESALAALGHSDIPVTMRLLESAADTAGRDSRVPPRSLSMGPTFSRPVHLQATWPAGYTRLQAGWLASQPSTK